MDRPTSGLLQGGSERSQIRSNVVGVTLPIVGIAAVNIAPRRVELSLVGPNLALELGNADAESAILALAAAMARLVAITRSWAKPWHSRS